LPFTFFEVTSSEDSILVWVAKKEIFLILNKKHSFFKPPSPIRKFLVECFPKRKVRSNQGR
jgi:hypothetical protein